MGKNALKRGQLHKDGTKEAVESLRIGQELRRKMNHVNDDDSSSSSSSEDNSSSKDSDDESEEANDTKNGFAKKKTKKMIKQMAKDANVPKGIMALKFMQRATDTQRQKAMEEAQDLLAELEGDGKSSNKQATKNNSVGRRRLGQGSSHKMEGGGDASINGKKRERIDSLEGSEGMKMKDQRRRENILANNGKSKQSTKPHNN